MLLVASFGADEHRTPVPSIFATAARIGPDGRRIRGSLRFGVSEFWLICYSVRRRLSFFDWWVARMGSMLTPLRGESMAPG
ncbi:MAG: hypothetical protein CMJ48_10290, partial [Planctomycetaceae bacterium]|nr:hypothetical protein [Planctomycetaceae bacterium]